ncbi:ferredoxin--NADP reductase [Halobium palmae]|uniref:Ferredoxin--NADP reductase n=1 Tax=Halobium palmae TaxID=1776492 RepID=A0ABD5S055_9EURY
MAQNPDDADPHDPHAHGKAEGDVEPYDQMLTESDAEVTVVEPMDEDRSEEVLGRLADRWPMVEETLEEQDLSEDPPDRIEDWAGISDMLADADVGFADTVDTLVNRAQRPYPSLLKLRFEPEEMFEFVPGHYARISFEDYPPRVYSIASSPNRDYVELTVRRVPGGHLTPHLCEELEVGDDLFVRGPYGEEFGLEEPNERDVVFIATGTGVAPFWSMINFLFEEGWDEVNGDSYDVYLILGSSWEDDLAYHEEWRTMDDERDNFHYIPTLSRESKLTEWEGETDYVQQVLLKCLDDGAIEQAELPDALQGFVGEDLATGDTPNLDPEELELFICGIGAMANQVREVAKHGGVPERRRHVESYG